MNRLRYIAFRVVHRLALWLEPDVDPHPPLPGHEFEESDYYEDDWPITGENPL